MHGFLRLPRAHFDLESLRTATKDFMEVTTSKLERILKALNSPSYKALNGSGDVLCKFWLPLLVEKGQSNSRQTNAKQQSATNEF
eukprot:1056114-Pleurochrysis_carterae.AAC.2